MDCGASLGGDVDAGDSSFAEAFTVGVCSLEGPGMANGYESANEAGPSVDVVISVMVATQVEKEAEEPRPAPTGSVDLTLKSNEGLQNTNT